MPDDTTSAVLSEVLLPFVTDNMRPVVLEVSAQQKGTSGTREPSGSSIPASGGEPAKHDPVVKVSWKVDNPDNDALRYRVAFRREGQTLWRDVTKAEEVLTKSEYEWDTQSLPEGKYRVRVEASVRQHDVAAVRRPRAHAGHDVELGNFIQVNEWHCGSLRPERHTSCRFIAQ